MIVPPHLRAEPHLVLQYGHDLPIPIPDLEVDEHGVRATLSFSKNPQRTFVPWTAVYVVTCNDGRGVLYHEDVPEDVSIIATHPHGDRMPDETVTVGAGRDDGEELGDLLPGGEAEGDVPGGDMPEGDMPEGDMIEGEDTFESSQEHAVAASGSSGRISRRLLRLVPHDAAGAAAAFAPPVAGRRRRKPQLRLVK